VRLVEVSVPAGKRESVLSALDDEGIDYVVTEETSGREYTAVVSFPVPKTAVEPVLEKLRECGVAEDAFTVVLDAETVISRRFEELQDRYDEESGNNDRIAREELTAQARDLAPNMQTYLVLTGVSAIVATAGLLLDSPAVVVGSMVIAPLIGPAMATAVGSVLGHRDLFLRGVKLQALGGLLAVGASAVFAYVARASGAVPLGPREVFAIGEVAERLQPGVLSLAVALAAGVAGAYSLSFGVSAALVGVMIAAALVPPTAVVGIGLAWGEPAAIAGSAVLVLVNFLSVNLSALVVLLYQGYHPEGWLSEDRARSATVKRIAVLVVVIGVLSMALAAVSYSTFQTANYEENAREAIRDELEAQPTELTLVSVDTRFGGEVFRQPRRLVVTVGYPTDADPPSLRERLTEAVRGVPSDRFGIIDPTAVEVEVRYVAYEGPSPDQPSSVQPPPAPPRVPATPAGPPFASPTAG
jgi:uncharacterized hydrophobic protein (TIGR00341 family)